ncbi:sporulation integral membrane protein YtvI [Bacillus sp. 2205SS5-2]|uniref:sporulation integral membrane protein YtvI n=1 Tax=Bacillus sp. 2205SS5-2 TaxID=3109031 RepID=UPI003004A48F
MNIVYLHRFLRFLFVIFSIVSGMIAAYYVSTITYPFIIAIIIAFLMNPLVNFLEIKIRLPRTLAVFISILFILAIFAGLITLLITEIVSGADYLSNVLPSHVRTLVEFAEDFIAAQVIPFYERMSSLFNSLETGQQGTIIANIQNAGEKIASSAGDFLQTFFQFLPTLFSWIPNAATVIVFTALATFFISKDWDKLRSLAAHYLPIKAKASGKTVFIDLKKALLGFLRAQVTLISITTIIILIGLIILRVDYAITIALVTGLVDVIPYLGTAAVLIPWMVFELITGNIKLGVGLGVLYVVVAIQRQIMEPKILSSSIGMDPLATLIALFVGFKLIGFLGLIVGPVTLVILTTLKRAGIFHDLWIFIKGDSTP